MIKRTKIAIYSILSLFLSSLAVSSSAQQVEGLVNRGDNLKNIYRFEEALASYRMALETAEQQSDSMMARIVEDRILMAENGRNMTAFSYSPKVVARHKFSIEDFYLYYPLEDRSWRQLPNVLDSAADHRYHKATQQSDCCPGGPGCLQRKDRRL